VDVWSDLFNPATLAVALAAATLVVALAAIRLAYEQARAYLFTRPAAYIDRRKGGLLLRNFGPGAMLDLRGDIRLASVGAELPPREFAIAGLAPSEHHVLLKTDLLDEVPLLTLEVHVAYAAINGKRRQVVLQLSGTDLSGLN